MSFFAESVSDFVTPEEAQRPDPRLGIQPEPTSQHLILDSFDTEEDSSAVARKAKMPSFSDSFWSNDYAGGLGILFQKLQQGVTENQQMLTVASMRADAEELYSERLGDIAPTIDRMTGGFSRDEGASVKKVITIAVWSRLC